MTSTVERVAVIGRTRFGAYSPDCPALMVVVVHDMTDQPDSSGKEQLVSWKRIARYLQCGERTARRWAAEECLPVHRHTRGSRGLVFAYRRELDAWLRSRADDEMGANDATTADGSNGQGPSQDVLGHAPADGPNLALDHPPFSRPALISGIVLAALSIGALAALESCAPGAENSRSVAFDRIEVGSFRVINTTSGDAESAAFAESLSTDIVTVITENNMETVAAGAGAAGAAAEFRLTGDVEPEANQYIVRIRLHHAASGTQFWSHIFRRDREEASGLRDQVSGMTASVIGCMLTFRANEHEMARETVRAYLSFCNAAAEQPYFLFRNLTTYSERILKSDPDSPKAMAIHAYVLATTHVGFWKARELQKRQSQDRQQRVRVLAERALKRDPDNRIALTTLALVLPEDEITLAQRVDLLRRATSGGWPPNITAAGRWTYSEREYAGLLRKTGRLADALVIYRNLLQADPSDVFALVAIAWDGAVVMRTYEVAGDLLDRAERLNPNFHAIHQRRLEIDLFLNDPAAALDYLKDPLRSRTWPESDMRRCLEAFARARMSTRPDIGALAVVCRTAVQPDWLGRMYACLGDMNRAYAVLDPPAYSSVILFWPCMKKFRHDSRFFPLAAKFGLVDYWLETDQWPDFCREKDLPFDCKERALTFSNRME